MWYAQGTTGNVWPQTFDVTNDLRKGNSGSSIQGGGGIFGVFSFEGACFQPIFCYNTAVRINSTVRSTIIGWKNYVYPSAPDPRR